MNSNNQISKKITIAHALLYVFGGKERRCMGCVWGVIMGQTLARNCANIRLRIINGTLFLCNSLMCQAQSQL